MGGKQFYFPNFNYSDCADAFAPHDSVEGILSNSVSYCDYNVLLSTFSPNLYRFIPLDSDMSAKKLRQWCPRFLCAIAELLGAINDGRGEVESARKLAVVDGIFDFLTAISTRLLERETCGIIAGGRSLPMRSGALSLDGAPALVTPLRDTPNRTELLLSDGSYYFGEVAKRRLSNTATSFASSWETEPAGGSGAASDSVNTPVPEGHGYLVLYAEMKAIHTRVIMPILELITAFRGEEQIFQTVTPANRVRPHDTVRVIVDGREVPPQSRFGAADKNRICRLMDMVRTIVLSVSRDGAEERAQLFRYGGAFERGLFGAAGPDTRIRPSGALVLDGFLSYEGTFMAGRFHGLGRLAIFKEYLGFLRNSYDVPASGSISRLSREEIDKRIAVSDSIIETLFETIGVFSCTPQRTRTVNDSQGTRSRTVLDYLAGGISALMARPGARDDSTASANELAEQNARMEIRRLNTPVTIASMYSQLLVPFVQSEGTSRSNTRQLLWREYEGGFLNNGLNGIGFLQYINGETYLGPLREGIRHSVIPVAVVRHVSSFARRGRERNASWTDEVAPKPEKGISGSTFNQSKPHFDFFSEPPPPGTPPAENGSFMNSAADLPQMSDMDNSRATDESPGGGVRGLSRTQHEPQLIFLNGWIRYSNGDQYYGIMCNESCGGFVVVDSRSESVSRLGLVTNKVEFFAKANAEALAKESELSAGCESNANLSVLPYSIWMGTAVKTKAGKHMMFVGTYVCGEMHGHGVLKYNLNTTSSSTVIALLEEVAHSATRPSRYSTDEAFGHRETGGAAGAGDAVDNSSGGTRTVSSNSYFEQYRGEFRSGVINGYGTMLYANGDVYRGCWRHEIREGPGEFIFTFLDNSDVVSSKNAKKNKGGDECPASDQRQGKPAGTEASYKAPLPIIHASSSKLAGGPHSSSTKRSCYITTVRNIIMRGRFFKGLISDDSAWTFMVRSVVNHNSVGEITRFVRSGQFQDALLGVQVSTHRESATKFINLWDAYLDYVFKGKYNLGMRIHGTLWSFEFNAKVLQNLSSKQDGEKTAQVVQHQLPQKKLSAVELRLRAEFMNSACGVPKPQTGSSFCSSLLSASMDSQSQVESDAVSSNPMTEFWKINTDTGLNAVPVYRNVALRSAFHGKWVGDAINGYGEAWYTGADVRGAIELFATAARTAFSSAWFSASRSKSLPIPSLNEQNALLAMTQPENYIYYYYGGFSHSQRHGRGCLAVLFCVNNIGEASFEGSNCLVGSDGEATPPMESYLNVGIMDFNAGRNKAADVTASQLTSGQYVVLAEYAGEWQNDDFVGGGTRMLYVKNVLLHALDGASQGEERPGSRVKADRDPSEFLPLLKAKHREVCLTYFMGDRVVSVGNFAPDLDIEAKRTASKLDPPCKDGIITGNISEVISNVVLRSRNDSSDNQLASIKKLKTLLDTLCENSVHILPISTVPTRAIADSFTDLSAPGDTTARTPKTLSSQKSAEKSDPPHAAPEVHAVAYPLLYGYHGEYKQTKQNNSPNVISQSNDANGSLKKGVLNSQHRTLICGAVRFRDRSEFIGSFAGRMPLTFRSFSQTALPEESNLLRHGPGVYILNTNSYLSEMQNITVGKGKQRVQPLVGYKSCDMCYPVCVIGSWSSDVLHTEEKSSGEAFVVYNDGSFYYGEFCNGMRSGFGVFAACCLPFAASLALTVRIIKRIFCDEQLKDCNFKSLLESMDASAYNIYSGNWVEDKQVSLHSSLEGRGDKEGETLKPFADYLFLTDPNEPVFSTSLSTLNSPHGSNVAAQNSLVASTPGLTISGFFDGVAAIGSVLLRGLATREEQAKLSVDPIGYRLMCAVTGKWYPSEGSHITNSRWASAEASARMTQNGIVLDGSVNREASDVGKLNGIATFLFFAKQSSSRSRLSPESIVAIKQVETVWNHLAIDLCVSDHTLGKIQGEVCTPSSSAVTGTEKSENKSSLLVGGCLSRKEIVGLSLQLKTVTELTLLCTACGGGVPVDIKAAVQGKGLLNASVEGTKSEGTATGLSSLFFGGSASGFTGDPFVTLATILSGEVGILDAKNTSGKVFSGSVSLGPKIHRLINVKNKCFLCRRFYCSKCLASVSNPSSLLALLPPHGGKGIALRPQGPLTTNTEEVKSPGAVTRPVTIPSLLSTSTVLQQEALNESADRGAEQEVVAKASSGTIFVCSDCQCRVATGIQLSRCWYALPGAAHADKAPAVPGEQKRVIYYVGETTSVRNLMRDGLGPEQQLPRANCDVPDGLGAAWAALGELVSSSGQEAEIPEVRYFYYGRFLAGQRDTLSKPTVSSITGKEKDRVFSTLRSAYLRTTERARGKSAVLIILTGGTKNSVLTDVKLKEHDVVNSSLVRNPFLSSDQSNTPSPARREEKSSSNEGGLCVYVGHFSANKMEGKGLCRCDTIKCIPSSGLLAPTPEWTPPLILEGSWSQGQLSDLSYIGQFSREDESSTDSLIEYLAARDEAGESLARPRNYYAEHKYRRHRLGVSYERHYNRITGITTVVKHDGSWRFGFKEGAGVTSVISVSDLYSGKSSGQQRSQSGQKGSFYSRVIYGTVYIGQYHNDRPHGYGVMIQLSRTGSQLSIEKKELKVSEKCEEKGEYCICAYSLFSGMFVHGAKHGPGSLVTFDSQGTVSAITEGVWYNDNLQGRVRVWFGDAWSASEHVKESCIYDSNQEQCNVFYIPVLFNFSEGINLLANTQPDGQALTCDPQRPEWQSGEGSSRCFICGTCFGVSFTSIFVSKHHCRSCGRLVCPSCSRRSLVLPSYFYRSKTKTSRDAEERANSPAENTTFPGRSGTEEKDKSTKETYATKIRAKPAKESMPAVRVCEICYYMFADDYDDNFFTKTTLQRSVSLPLPVTEKESSTPAVIKELPHRPLTPPPALKNTPVAGIVSAASVCELHAGAASSPERRRPEVLLRDAKKPIGDGHVRGTSMAVNGDQLFFSQRGNSSCIRVISYPNNAIYVGPLRNQLWWVDFYVFCRTKGARSGASAAELAFLDSGKAVFSHIYMPALYITPEGKYIIIDITTLSTIAAVTDGSLRSVEEQRSCLDRLPAATPTELSHFCTWYDRVLKTIVSHRNSGEGTTLSRTGSSVNIKGKNVVLRYDNSISSLDVASVLSGADVKVEAESLDANMRSALSGIMQSLRPIPTAIPFKVLTFTGQLRQSSVMARPSNESTARVSGAWDGLGLVTPSGCSFRGSSVVTSAFSTAEDMYKSFDLPSMAPAPTDVVQAMLKRRNQLASLSPISTAGAIMKRIEAAGGDSRMTCYTRSDSSSDSEYMDRVAEDSTVVSYGEVSPNRTVGVSAVPPPAISCTSVLGSEVVDAVNNILHYGTSGGLPAVYGNEHTGGANSKAELAADTPPPGTGGAAGGGAPINAALTDWKTSLAESPTPSEGFAAAAVSGRFSAESVGDPLRPCASTKPEKGTAQPSYMTRARPSMSTLNAAAAATPLCSGLSSLETHRCFAYEVSFGHWDAAESLVRERNRGNQIDRDVPQSVELKKIFLNFDKVQGLLAGVDERGAMTQSDIAELVKDALDVVARVEFEEHISDS